MSTAVATDARTDRPQDEVRLATRASNDPRPARTRAAILAAVEELAAQGVVAPSVTEIVRAAGISRSSFYTQFASLEELTARVFGRALREALQWEAAARSSGRLSDFEATRQATARLVTHIAEHRGLYRLGLPGSPGAQVHAVTALARQLEEGACVTAAPENGVTVAAATTYLAGGMLALLGAWLSDQLVATPEQITDQLMAMLPAWLTTPSTPHPH